MSSNPNLLRIVQVSQCDVDFWTQQVTEHTLFLHRLLNPDAVPALKQEAKTHYSAWYGLLKQSPVKYDADMLNSLYAFLEIIHNKIGERNQTGNQRGIVQLRDSNRVGIQGVPINLELSIS